MPAEFNVPRLAACQRRWLPDRKGPHRADRHGEALRVAGVLDVLTHENRPPMASTDKA